MNKLDRNLGLGSVVAIAIGSMIGGGIFVLPGLAAATTGPSFWLAYALAGLFVVPAALSQSEMATAMPKAGGVYIFVDRSLGPLYGTIAGIGTWLAMLFKASFALVGISVYLSIFSTFSYKVVAFALLVLVALLNIVGVKKLGKFQMVVVAACGITLGMLIVKGFVHLEPSRFQNYFSNGWSGLLAATGLVFISYAGVTKIASIAEEIVDPSRNLPLAMLLSLGLMMLLYSLVAFCLVGNIPMTGTTAVAGLAKNERAIALLGSVLYGKFGLYMMAAIAIVALASMANAGLLSASRYPFAMSRDEMVPSFFQRVSERFVTPVYSIVFTAICMAAAIMFLPVVKIAKLASGMQVILFMAINVAIIILRENHPSWYQPKFRSPLYPGMQIFGILSCLLMLVMLGSFVLIGTALLLLAGAGWYYIYARHKTRRRGVIQKITTRPEIKAPKVSDEMDSPPKVPPSDLVISLSGKEFSPESLLAIGSALGSHKISVLKLREIPDQLTLHDRILEMNPRMKVLERRVQQMSKRLSLETNIDFIATHDQRHALFDYVSQSQNPWTLVDMGQHDRFYQARRYLGWLVTHLPSNLAIYQNEGFRITENILVLYGQTPSDQLVLEVANNLAEIYDARLRIMSVLPEDSTQEERDERKASMEAAALPRLTVQNYEIKMVIGDFLEQVVQESIEHELMVMGLPRTSTRRGFVKGSPHDRLFEDVACSVLTIKAAPGLSLPPRIPSSLPDLLDARTIRLHDNVKDKDELFEHLAQLFAKVTEQPLRVLQEALQAPKVSEEARVLPSGVVLLQASHPCLKRTHVGMVFLDQPFPTKDPSTTEANLVVLTMNPETGSRNEAVLEQLRLLMADSHWISQLHAAPNTDYVMRLIRSKYAELV
ncbi:MAG: amino acid permease [Deltaproteobacteria bacterium]|nr:MAG: amino acid permease [Deltaproteobacteria bacterium]